MPKFFLGFPSWLRLWRPAPVKAAVELEMPRAELPPGVFPLLPASELLLRFTARVSRIEELAGTTPLHFERYYLDTLHRFARWSQQRPASHPRYGHPGGLLGLGLETAAAALKIRQGYLLPPGAVPEEAVLKKDLWTFAVFTLALLHHARQPAMEQRVTLLDGDTSWIWNPWTGTMADFLDVSGYRVAFHEKPDARLPQNASLMLAHLIVAPDGLVWLASDKDVLAAWMACLTGNLMATGALGDIIGKALRHFAPLPKPNAQAQSAPRETAIETAPAPVKEPDGLPLYERMLSALRDLVDAGELPFNAMDATAWRKGDDLWLESPAIADSLRAKLSAEGHGDALGNNQSVLNLLQDAGVLALCEGKAVWRVAVHDGSLERKLAALRIPACRIWPDLESAPLEFAGTIDWVKQASPENGKEAPAAKFVEWLSTGIAEGRIPYNGDHANVQVVPEGVLLLVPGLFQDFVAACGGGRPDIVQQLFVKRKDHVRTVEGDNIHHYVVGSGQSQTALSGFLLKDSSLVFGVLVPIPNAFVYRRIDDERLEGY